MILAVQVFNSASLNFKTEVFAILVNVAWTYLLHEYYLRNGVRIIGADGRSLLLSQMIERHDCPISAGAKSNLKAMKLLRDEVEHKLMGRSDPNWFGLFQACCVNFEKTLCTLFGEELTLSRELSLALQFTKINFDQAVELNRLELPSHIDALDARLIEGMSEEEVQDLEFRFRVVYTLDAASKSRAHLEFVRPDSAEGKEIRNVLVNYKSADQYYPHKPAAVANLVSRASGKRFTTNNHTQAWRHFSVRPINGTANPERTNKEYCIYHAAHRDYTYSQKWVDKLVAEIEDGEKFAAIKAVRIN